MPPKRATAAKKNGKAEVVETTGTGKKAAGKTKAVSESSEEDAPEVTIAKSEKIESTGKAVAVKGKGKAAVKSEESESGSSADEKPAVKAPASSKATAVTTKAECSENDSSSEDKPVEKAPAAAKGKAGAKPKAAAAKGKKNGDTAHHEEADSDEKPPSKTAPKQVGKLQALAQKATNGKKAAAEVKVSSLFSTSNICYSLVS